MSLVPSLDGDDSGDLRNSVQLLADWAAMSWSNYITFVTGAVYATRPLLPIVGGGHRVENEKNRELAREGFNCPRMFNNIEDLTAALRLYGIQRDVDLKDIVPDMFHEVTFRLHEFLRHDCLLNAALCEVFSNNCFRSIHESLVRRIDSYNVDTDLVCNKVLQLFAFSAYAPQIDVCIDAEGRAKPLIGMHYAPSHVVFTGYNASDFDQQQKKHYIQNNKRATPNLSPSVALTTAMAYTAKFSILPIDNSGHFLFYHPDADGCNILMPSKKKANTRSMGALLFDVDLGDPIGSHTREAKIEATPVKHKKQKGKNTPGSKSANPAPVSSGGKKRTLDPTAAASIKRRKRQETSSRDSSKKKVSEDAKLQELKKQEKQE
ncbi:MAG: hypothetical protein JKY54_03515, partial [Flavobacteriales bacterium]|nr:hypothetical protein [Flavobacteriales bacterium]